MGSSINTILIGQLSKNYQNGNNQYISGELLMSLIIDHVKKMDEFVPSVSVCIECEDNHYLRHYYEKYGFVYFGTNDNGLLQYIVPTRKFVSPEYKNHSINNQYHNLISIA